MTEKLESGERRDWRPRPRGFVKRGLNREESAEYIGVSVSKFDEMVRDGRMPQPRLIDRRKVWDIEQLDAAFRDLPGGGWHDPSANPDHLWGQVA
jgi:predicted DNA-binding transcriptional regulator AlpA